MGTFIDINLLGNYPISISKTVRAENEFITNKSKKDRIKELFAHDDCNCDCEDCRQHKV